MASKKHKSKPVSTANTDRKKKLAPKCYQHSEASRADTTNISSKRTKPNHHKRAYSALLLYRILLNMSRK